MIFSKTPKPASFNKIRRQILSKWLLKRDKGCSVIALTSRSRKEGVSTIATGLIKSFNATSANDKTLLIDASSKSRRKLHTLDISNTEVLADLTNLIPYDEKLGSDCITLSPHNQNKLDIFTSDDSPKDIVNTEDVNRSFLDQLKDIYNIIMIDTGNLDNQNGTFWLANSDYNILIIDSSRTTRESLEYQKKEFENSEISIDGSILNKRKFSIPSYLYWLTR